MHLKDTNVITLAEMIVNELGKKRAGHLIKWIETCLEEDIEDKWQKHDCHLSPEDGCKTCEEYFKSR